VSDARITKTKSKKEKQGLVMPSHHPIIWWQYSQHDDFPVVTNMVAIVTNTGRYYGSWIVEPKYHLFHDIPLSMTMIWFP
jgi:hypothetical protein